MQSSLKSWLRSVSMAVRLYWLGLAWLGITALGIAAMLAANALLYFGEEIAAADATYDNDVGGVCPLGPRDGSAGWHERRSAQGVTLYGGNTAQLPPRPRASSAAGVCAGRLRPGSFRALRRPHLQRDPCRLRCELCQQPANESERCGPARGGSARGRGTLVHRSRTGLRLRALGRWHCGHRLGRTAEYRGLVHGIAASGAGWQKADFDSAACGAPLPVLVMHGAYDGHFPGFGRAAAAYWSACNRFEDAGRPEVLAGTCHRFAGCAAPTVYCETNRSHWRWAGDPSAIIDFLAREAGKLGK